MIPHYKQYINGEFMETGAASEIINPSTNEVLAQVSLASKSDIELACMSARAAFDKGAWARISLGERKRYLLKVSEGILDRAHELAKLETANCGKPIKETTFMDVPSAAKTFEYFANNLEQLLKNDLRQVSEDTKAEIVLEPQGVAVLIVPWNYPLLIASWKMAQALAAGNTLILKPSSLTPLTALELARIVHDSGLPKGVVNIVCASGQDMGEALCCDKRIDMVSFTGSNEVGKKILGYSSKHVFKLIMELGGKSAGIVCQDADIELAVNGSLCSIFLNQGQMCTSMSRIFVHEDIYDSFISDFVDKTKRIKVGLADDYQTQMGPLISESHRKKVLGYIEKAVSQGAELLTGAKPLEDKILNRGFFIEPAVLVNIDPAMQIFKEEVFGPVAGIIRYKNIDEAVELANLSDFGLAASIWSRNTGLAKEIGNRLNAGTIWINTYGMFYNELPYGGFKQSGFGKELGKEGLLEYSRIKNILIDSPKDSKPLVNYWYGF